MENIYEILLTILLSAGGVGAIILSFSRYIAQIFIKRYEEELKAKFQNEINHYQSQLEIIKQTSLKYNDKQFEHYSLLWASLYDLKVLADSLWSIANSVNLEKFSKQLSITRTEIERSSLFIEDSHYDELINIIHSFSEYQIGKSSLIKYRSNQSFDEFQVGQMIDQNANHKSNYEILIRTIKADLKRQMGGN
ncbi:hypothetical protein [Pontibacter burrus]|uniref:Uncharacterized protein n=1 Tax=Pontibacter burrus TaxID=2704466 RepID=A0A6B3LQC2_9BACT|nr:hypothetical protein [Pontibacter burrus]NEM96396.1 hypothetical protein [Pontibacter burrus]